MSLRIVTEPDVEPIALKEAKDHVRVDFTTDDDLIGRLITAARRAAERTTNRVFVEQTWDLKGGGFPAGDRIEIPKGRLRSVGTFSYLTEAKAEVNVASSVYDVDLDEEPGCVFLKPSQSWPSVCLYPKNAVKVRFTAGYAQKTNAAAGAGTTDTSLVLTTHGLKVGDQIINRTRADALRRVDAIVDANTITVLSVTGQVETDSIDRYDLSSVPAEIRSAILLAVGTLYLNRTDQMIGQGLTLVKLPGTIDALLAPYRLWEF